MNRRAETKDNGPVFALLASAALVSVLTALSVGMNGRTDFRGFFESAQRWNAGADPYATFSGNLNPPLVTALLFRPLTALPFLTAFLAWAAVSLTAWLAIVRVLPAKRRLEWLVASAACGSSWVCLKLGQVGFVFAALIAAAYLADKRGMPFRAGVAMGLALAWKPFVGLVVLWWLVTRRWVALAWCVATFTCVVVFQVWVWGWPLFSKWLLEVRNTTIPNLTHLANASLPGLIARVGADPSLGAIAALCVALLGLTIARRTTLSSAWVALLSAGLLASPLGWVYYLPILIAPLADRWEEFPRQPWRIGLVALFCVPVVPAVPLPSVVEIVWSACAPVGLLMLLTECAWQPLPLAQANGIAVARRCA